MNLLLVTTLGAWGSRFLPLLLSSIPLDLSGHDPLSDISYNLASSPSPPSPSKNSGHGPLSDLFSALTPSVNDSIPVIVPFFDLVIRFDWSRG
jgi:hypothetical protein